MLLNMAYEYQENSYEVHFVVLTKTHNDYAIDDTNISVHYLNRKRAVKSIGTLACLIRNIRPDIIISALTYVNLLTILARLLSWPDLPYLLISERAYHSVNAKKTIKSYKLQLLLMRIFYRFATKVIGISEGVTEDIRKIAKLPLSKTATIYNPVITKKLASDMDETSAFNFPEGRSIISCGRLEDIKDYPTQLRAFKHLYSKHKDLHLVIVGEGSQKENLQDLARSMGISQRVHFTGFVRNPMPLYKKADLFVLTSLSEGFGNVIVEAMYAGTPVICTDCPSGPREILKDMPERLIPVGDDKALAKAIEQELEHKSDPAPLKKRAFDFHVSQISEKYLQQIEGI